MLIQSATLQHLFFFHRRAALRGFSRQKRTLEITWCTVMTVTTRQMQQVWVLTSKWTNTNWSKVSFSTGIQWKFPVSLQYWDKGYNAQECRCWFLTNVVVIFMPSVVANLLGIRCVYINGFTMRVQTAFSHFKHFSICTAASLQQISLHIQAA